MIKEKIPEIAGLSYTFRDRGTAIPGDHRPVWRMALVVCLLKHCSRAQKSSLVRLHILDWAVRRVKARDQLLAFLQGELGVRYICVRYDPALLRAVLFGEGEQLLKVAGKNVQLLLAGERLAGEVETSKTILSKCPAARKASLSTPSASADVCICPMNSARPTAKI